VRRMPPFVKGAQEMIPGSHARAPSASARRLCSPPPRSGVSPAVIAPLSRRLATAYRPTLPSSNRNHGAGDGGRALTTSAHGRQSARPPPRRRAMAIATAAAARRPRKRQRRPRAPRTVGVDLFQTIRRKVEGKTAVAGSVSLGRMSKQDPGFPAHGAGDQHGGAGVERTGSSPPVTARACVLVLRGTRVFRAGAYTRSRSPPTEADATTR